MKSHTEFAKRSALKYLKTGWGFVTLRLCESFERVGCPCAMSDHDICLNECIYVGIYIRQLCMGGQIQTACSIINGLKSHVADGAANHHPVTIQIQPISSHPSHPRSTHESKEQKGKGRKERKKERRKVRVDGSTDDVVDLSLSMRRKE
jgi:hypothetical protein